MNRAEFNGCKDNLLHSVPGQTIAHSLLMTNQHHRTSPSTRATTPLYTTRKKPPIYIEIGHHSNNTTQHHPLATTIMNDEDNVATFLDSPFYLDQISPNRFPVRTNPPAKGAHPKYKRPRSSIDNPSLIIKRQNKWISGNKDLIPPVAVQALEPIDATPLTPENLMAWQQQLSPNRNNNSYNNNNTKRSLTPKEKQKHPKVLDIALDISVRDNQKYLPKMHYEYYLRQKEKTQRLKKTPPEPPKKLKSCKEMRSVQISLAADRQMLISPSHDHHERKTKIANAAYIHLRDKTHKVLEKKRSTDILEDVLRDNTMDSYQNGFILGKHAIQVARPVTSFNRRAKSPTIVGDVVIPSLNLVQNVPIGTKKLKSSGSNPHLHEKVDLGKLLTKF